MDISKFADIADLLAGIGVIASLLFVAIEVRRNTAEVKRTAWESTIDRIGAALSRTAGESLPEIIHKGRQDYRGLSKPDQIAFWNYHFEMCLAYEAVFVLGANQVHGQEIIEVVRRHVSHLFSFAGTQQWWREFSSNFGLSPLMNIEVEKAIENAA